MNEEVKLTPVVPVDDAKRPGPEYPSNSHASRDEAAAKAEKPKLKSAVTTPVKHKKGFLKKVGESFTGDDAQSVGNYLLFDVMIPAAKSLISDMVTQGIERSLFGESGGRRQSTGGRPRQTYNTGYDRMHNQSNSRAGMDVRDRDRGMNRQSRANHNFDGIVLSSRVEAEDVIFQLRERIAQYNVTTVADLYDLLDMTSTYVDGKYGWFDLEGQLIERTRGGGYHFMLPRPESLDS